MALTLNFIRWFLLTGELVLFVQAGIRNLEFCQNTAYADQDCADGMKMEEHVSVNSKIECAPFCRNRPDCLGFVYSRVNSTCDLLNAFIGPSQPCRDVVGNLYYHTPECEPGWFYYEKKCIFLMKSLMTWDQAKSNCEDLGSTLNAVRTETENTFIGALVLNPNNGPEYFLGARRGPGPVWMDGSPMTYTPQGGIPGDGYCLGIADYSLTWSWRNCNETNYSICQKSPPVRCP